MCRGPLAYGHATAVRMRSLTAPSLVSACHRLLGVEERLVQVDELDLAHQPLELLCLWRHLLRLAGASLRFRSEVADVDEPVVAKVSAHATDDLWTPFAQHLLVRGGRGAQRLAVRAVADH